MSSAVSAPSGLADTAIAGGVVNKAGDTASQTLTGSADPGVTVTVYDGATKLGVTTADASTGAWSYTLGHLNDGSHSLTATATDATSAVSAASAALAFKVDATAPVAPNTLADTSIVKGYVTAAGDTAAQALTGKAEALATVTVYDNGAQIGTATADGAGAWSYTLGQLPDGSHSLTATATDAAGNTGVASAALAFKVDTAAPAAPAGLTESGIIGGYVNAAHDTASQRLTGTAEAGATVAVYDGATKLGAAVAGPSGSWTYILGTLSDGAHSLTATATDAAGNVSASSAALAFTVDTQIPGAPGGLADTAIIGGAVNKAGDTASQTLTGSADPGVTVTVYDGATKLGVTTADASTGAWSYTLGHLNDGLHSLTAKASDAAGNVSAASAALAFKVDATAPTAPNTLADTSIVKGYVNAAGDTAAQALTGKAEALATVTVYDNGAQIGTATADGTGVWSYTLGQLPDGGSHSLTATATDAVGNTGVASAALAFKVDTTVPGAPTGLTDSGIIGGYVNAAHATGIQKLTGAAEAGATVTVYDGSTKLGVALASATGTWSYTLGTLSDGVHSLTATATDAAGNVSASSAALAFTVDATPPATPGGLADSAIVGGYVNKASDIASQTLTGSADPGVTVTVYDGSTKLGVTTADASTGAWSYTLGHLIDGAHSLTAKASDAVGNLSAASTALAFKVDATAPAAPNTLADAGVVNGYVNAANDTATHAVTGKAEALATVTVYDNGAQIGTATADGTGAWSYTLGQLPNGSHSLTATATDAAGNTGVASAALAFKVDSAAPAAPAGLADSAIIGGYVDAAHDTISQKLTGTAEAGATVTVYDGATKLGTALASGAGAWSYTLGTLSDGAHSLTATATDAAGNTGPASAALAFTVATQPSIVAAGGVQFNIYWDASVDAWAPAAFKAGVLAVAQLYASTFTDPVTVNLDVGYGEVDAITLPANVLGESLTYFTSTSYGQLTAALRADASSATDSTAIQTLPATDPTGAGHYWLTTANAKALGLYGGAGIDGYVGFSSSLTFDYDASNGVAAGTYDFFGVVAHEISEVMGRELLTGETLGGLSPSYTALDLFHYASAGVRDFVGTTAGYFSYDGGATHQQSFNTNASGDFGDWASSAGADAYDAFTSGGVVNKVNTSDLSTLDVIGWNQNPSASSATASLPASTTVHLGASATDGLLSVGAGFYSPGLVADVSAYYAA
jgi:hypothetical protein